jgi:hypothetical protein
MKQIIKAVTLLSCVVMLSAGTASSCLADGKQEAKRSHPHHREHSQKHDTENDDNGTHKTTPKPSPNPTPQPPAPTPTPAPTPSPAPAPGPDGAALYNSICAACHGNSKMHSSVAAIQAAINSNKGGMGSYSYLTPAQLAAISAY